VGAFVILAVCTLLPYGLLVKVYFLRGVPNLSETVPADYYFIQDASIALPHLLTLDMAGIMDKVLTGDYLAKEPRWPNLVYTAIMFLPLFKKRVRDDIFNTEALRAFCVIAYFITIFSVWATLGYSDPAWFPTFHRVIEFISLRADATHTGIGDLVVKLFGTIIQVLRFPHRFEFFLFMTACVLTPMGLIWIYETWLTSGSEELLWILTGRRARKSSATTTIKSKPQPAAAGLAPAANEPHWSIPLITVLLVMIPLFSNGAYRLVFFSGNFYNFLTPYPVGPLQEVKDALLQLPPGKTVVLPPTETAKIDLDVNGVEHKFIDKFPIYYLDLPSYYYGLTGNSDNKHEFFLLLRAMYYQQPWWINIARDLNLRYIVINKEMVPSTAGGQEYLRGVEKILIPELDQRNAYVKKLMENESYALYEFTDLPTAERVPLYLDVSWNKFIQILSSNLELTRYYDLRYTMKLGDLENYESLNLVTDNIHDAALDLYLKSDKTRFFRPSSTILPFSPEQISSSYYLSPMFRLFQFFSDSKYNRLDMITPGLWGTVEGGFIGVPHAAPFRIDISLPEDGEYHLLMRGAISAVDLQMKSKLFESPQRITLASDPSNLAFFDKRMVFSSERTPMDISGYTLKELGLLVPSDAVVVNNKYQYFDLGTVTANKGKYPIYFTKFNDAPMLLEGILVVPEEQYRTLSLPTNVELVQPDNLCCGSIIIQGEEP